jgi:hypothetical protein
MLGRLKWVFVGLVVGGGALAWSGWQSQQVWSRLEANGKTTSGVIEEGSVSRGRRGRQTYEFTVGFTPEGGTPRQQAFTVTKDFAERVVKDDMIVMDQCTVRYDPTDPSVAIVVDGSKDERSMLPIGVGMSVVGAIGAFFALRRRKVGDAGDAQTG